ncbi:MAG: hypothetical protein AB1721_00985 [Patescibacteria group bacterium]
MVKFIEIVFVNYYFYFNFLFLLANLVFACLRYLGKISDQKFFTFVRSLFFLVLVFAGLRIFSLYLVQYLIWSKTEPFVYFLPPHQPISYFLSYAWLHFAKLPAFNFFLSAFLFFLIFLGAKLSRGRFFYSEEHYSGGIAILLNSWPDNFFVFILVLAFGCLGFVLRSAYLLFKNKKQLQPAYFSFRYLWGLVGLLVFLFGGNLVNLFNLGILKI